MGRRRRSRRDQTVPRTLIRSNVESWSIILLDRRTLQILCHRPGTTRRYARPIPWRRPTATRHTPSDGRSV